MYHGLSNCLTCGRLIAPTSGLYGTNNRNIFCCRRCLKEYYDDQPGLWDEELYQYELDREEQAERIRLRNLEQRENNRDYPTISLNASFSISLFVLLSFSLSDPIFNPHRS